MKPPPALSPRDATLATLAPGLADQLPFIRRIFGTMEKCHQVRIGITTNPSSPDYIIDEFMGDPVDPLDPNDHGQPVPMMAFNGRAHRAVSYERWRKTDNWSNTGMTWHNVQDLLADLQGMPRRERKNQIQLNRERSAQLRNFLARSPQILRKVFSSRPIVLVRSQQFGALDVSITMSR
jgi:hypothetical protein